jgi:hypothetical protein
VTNNALQKLLLIFLVSILSLSVEAQKPQDVFYYNPGGFTFVPMLKKPAIIYQGKLYTGRKQLTGLFNYLNNEELNLYYKKYKANRTASTILTVAGVGLSVYSLVDWRSSDKKFNWYTFAGGLVLSGASGYLDAKASENLRNAAVVFDKATRKTTFVPQQKTITLTISLAKHGK